MEHEYFIVIGSLSWGGGQYRDDAFQNWLKEIDTSMPSWKGKIKLVRITSKEVLTRKKCYVDGMGGLIRPGNSEMLEKEIAIDTKLMEKYQGLMYKVDDVMDEMTDPLYEFI